jgi:hypothetical protein
MMQEADLLYSGLIVTALMLSIWTGALLAAACVFFAPKFLAPRAHQSPLRKP